MTATKRFGHSIRAKFSRSVSRNVLFMSDNGGRRSNRTLTPLQRALNRERFVIPSRRVFSASPRRSPRVSYDILRRFLHNSVGAAHKRG